MRPVVTLLTACVILLTSVPDADMYRTEQVKQAALTATWRAGCAAGKADETWRGQMLGHQAVLGTDCATDYSRQGGLAITCGWMETLNGWA